MGRLLDSGDPEEVAFDIDALDMVGGAGEVGDAEQGERSEFSEHYSILIGDSSGSSGICASDRKVRASRTGATTVVRTAMTTTTP